MKQITMRNIIEAPRLAGIPTQLRNGAFQLGVEIDLDIDKGWFRETIRFVVRGPEKKVRAFARAVAQWAESVNSDD